MAGTPFDSVLQMLATDAERAGAAMACRYSSSDEYEAALIAERRRAGAYGRPLLRSRLFTPLLIVMLLTVIAWSVLR